MKKIGITGYDGTVGSVLVRRGCVPIKADITNVGTIDVSNLDVIIHCAALTSVNECEAHPDMAFKVNVTGTSNLISKMNKHQTLVYISTDHVFKGDKWYGAGYSEKHDPNPINIYGMTKWMGEEISRFGMCRSVVVRTSRLFNYEMMKNDISALQNENSTEFSALVKRSFLHVDHFVDNLLWLVDNLDNFPELKLLHVAGDEVMSYWQFWVVAANILNLADVNIIRRDWKLEEKYTGIVPRPFRAGLDVHRAKKLGMHIYSALDGIKLVERGI